MKAKLVGAVVVSMLALALAGCASSTPLADQFPESTPVEVGTPALPQATGASSSPADVEAPGEWTPFIQSYSGGVATVKWKEQFDGGEPTRFELYTQPVTEGVDPDPNSWKLIAEVPGVAGQQEYQQDVQIVDPGFYAWQVIAFNAGGESEPGIQSWSDLS